MKGRGSAMDASSDKPNKPPVGKGGEGRRGDSSGVPPQSDDQNRVGPYSIYSTGSTAVPLSLRITSRDAFEETMNTALPQPANSFLPMNFMDPQSNVFAAQPVNQSASGPTCTVVRPPGESPATCDGSGNAIQVGFVAQIPQATSVPTSASPGEIEAPTPNLPQAPPRAQGITVSHGMVLAQNETGKLLMIPQQVVGPIPAQAPVTLAPLIATPISVPPGLSSATPPFSISQLRGWTPVTTTQKAVAIVNPTTMTKETIVSLKKCKRFLSALVKLSSCMKRTPSTTVKDLVKDLLEGRKETEEFLTELCKVVKVLPQSDCLPFLKQSLPVLRQLTPDTNVFMKQSLHPQLAPARGSSSTSASAALGRSVPKTNASVCVRRLRPIQPATEAEQRKRMLTTKVTTQRNLGDRALAHLMLGQQASTKKMQQGSMKPVVPNVSHESTAIGLAQMNKLYEPGGLCKDYADFTDMASMAGVSLEEERANFLATIDELVGPMAHSSKEKPSLSNATLEKEELDIGAMYDVADLDFELADYFSNTQTWIQDVLGNISEVDQQRDWDYASQFNEQDSDVGDQLLFFEHPDQMEKQEWDEQEKEMHLKEAKQEGWAEINQMETINTGLAAISPKKQRISDSHYSASAEGSASQPSLFGEANWYTTQCQVNDLLENDQFISHSPGLSEDYLL